MLTIKRCVSIVSLAVLFLITANVPSGLTAELTELKLSGQGEPSTFLVLGFNSKGLGQRSRSENEPDIF